MTALHTPGPWDVREDYPDILAGEELIACAFGFANDKGMYVHTSTTHANAKLMSAAPVFLALLQEIANPENATASPSAIEQTCYSFDFEDWMAKVQSAVAKATGQT